MANPRTEAAGLRMKTFTDRNVALALTRVRNRAGTDVWVVVEGPEDNESTVMDLRGAIDAGFTYEWWA